MNPKSFFDSPRSTVHKHYEALRAFYNGECSAQEAADRFGYTLASFYSLARDFKKMLSKENPEQFFFISRKAGRKQKDASGEINRLIIALRKKYLSVPDIKAILDVQGYQVSQRYIFNVLKNDGFVRLPRRNLENREKALSAIRLKAPKSFMLDFTPETFNAENTVGALCILPYIKKYGIDFLISTSDYPETNSLNRLSSILSFVALKLSNVRRYAADDIWCMDRGLGLFAGLNVLPKTGWYTSYSNRVTRDMNRSFLKALNQIWLSKGLLSDTANLDFTSIPYWGDNSHLENNWSGTRNKALASICAIVAQEPDTGILTYGDTSVRHENKSDVVLEFLDFYKSSGDGDLKYLVFDSKFTTYENLGRLNRDGIKFITIRRRGTNIVVDLEKKPASSWKKVRVKTADGKGRTLKVIDESIKIKNYGDNIRQIAITGHGKIKPAILITNEFDAPCNEMIRKYTKRWIVEKEISEQIEFFHLNRVSSSMVIKVDFDLTMSILSHNLLRLFAMDLPGYSHNSDLSIYKKFLFNSGRVEIKNDWVLVKLKKKRNLPALLSAMKPFEKMAIGSLGNRSLQFYGDSTT